MVVDLPAPLGPRKPSTSPRGTENDTLSTARMGPNLLVRLRIAIISDISSCPSNVFGRAGPARLAAKSTGLPRPPPRGPPDVLKRADFARPRREAAAKWPLSAAG